MIGADGLQLNITVSFTYQLHECVFLSACVHISTFEQRVKIIFIFGMQWVFSVSLSSLRIF